MNKSITAVILAAGQGKRMNSTVAKQFLNLQGKPLLYYSIKAFEESSVDKIVLVTGSDQVEYCKQEIVDYYSFKKVTDIIEGGKERYDSVYQALMHLNQCDYVLIHDGARPFISVNLIERIIREVMQYEACIVGTPVKDTIKVVNEKGYITDTPDRTTLWSAQTPQAFSYSSIRKAYDMFYQLIDNLKLGITDDAMVYQTFIGEPVKVLQGEYNNYKITTPEDLTLAEATLDKRSNIRE